MHHDQILTNKNYYTAKNNCTRLVHSGAFLKSNMTLTKINYISFNYRPILLNEGSKCLES